MVLACLSGLLQIEDSILRFCLIKEILQLFQKGVCRTDAPGKAALALADRSQQFRFSPGHVRGSSGRESPRLLLSESIRQQHLQGVFLAVKRSVHASEPGGSYYKVIPFPTACT